MQQRETFIFMSAVHCMFPFSGCSRCIQSLRHSIFDTAKNVNATEVTFQVLKEFSKFNAPLMETTSFMEKAQVSNCWPHYIVQLLYTRLDVSKCHIVLLKWSKPFFNEISALGKGLKFQIRSGTSLSFYRVWFSQWAMSWFGEATIFFIYTALCLIWS